MLTKQIFILKLSFESAVKPMLGNDHLRIGSKYLSIVTTIVHTVPYLTTTTQMTSEQRPPFDNGHYCWVSLYTGLTV